MVKARWRIARTVFVAALLLVFAPQSLAGTRSLPDLSGSASPKAAPAKATAIGQWARAKASTAVLAEIDDDDDDDDTRCDESLFGYADQDRHVAAVVHRILSNTLPRVPFRLAAIRGRAPPAA